MYTITNTSLYVVERPVNQTMHFTRSETFGPEGPSSVVTTQTISTTKPARPQPEGLRARYTPIGVPAPTPAITLPNKAVTNVASQDASTSTPSKSSSKKKRKHTDDGEDGSVATAISTPIPVPKKDNANPNNKNNPAEKSAKKQKTNRNSTPKRETPVPLPMPYMSSDGNSANSGPKFTSFTSSATPRARMSASPGAALPVTQVPVKLTPVPVPSLPIATSFSTAYSSDGPSASQYSGSGKSTVTAAAAKKAERERKKAEQEAEKEAKRLERERKKAEKEQKKAGKVAAVASKIPSKVSSVPVPHFENGRPVI